VKVRRHRGARGQVIVPFKTIDGTAKEEKDYVSQNGELIFQNEETKATIYIEIINDDEYEKSEEFYVELGMPILKDGRQNNKEEGVPDGRPILGIIWMEIEPN
jgi:solute carrier family 8 (sodium/calcium exchanger)